MSHITPQRRARMTLGEAVERASAESARLYALGQDTGRQDALVDRLASAHDMSEKRRRAALLDMTSEDAEQAILGMDDAEVAQMMLDQILEDR